MVDTSSAVRRLVQWMPKAELHLHLDGCLRPITAMELAADVDVAAPSSYLGMFEALVAPPHPGSQAALLAAFDLPIALMQTRDALSRVTNELIEDKAADRVRYLEIKWAPAVHCARGLSVDEVITTVAAAARSAGRRFSVVVRLTVVAMRSAPPEDTARLAAIAVAHRDKGVSGFDLAGYEAADPDPAVHAEAFRIAREGGLGITLHAGELLDDGSLVRRALELAPDRIAHGASAVADPEVMAALIERRVTLDLCPSSNVQAGTVDTFGDHPLVTLVRHGVPVTINTDDTTISDTTLSEEMLRCIEELGLTLPELWRCNLQALEAAFLERPIVDALRAGFHAFAKGVPELADA